MKPLRVEPEAEDELSGAVAWYDEQRPGLGAEFFAAVMKTVEDVQSTPAAYPLVQRAPADLPARRAPVRRFPYMVVYFDLPEAVHVVAFAHDRQRPFYWRGRI